MVPLAALAIWVSFSGIHNGFTYDDRYIVLGRGLIHRAHDWWRMFAATWWPKEWGAEGYRPLTMIGFTWQWVAGNGTPRVFHVTNIALYALTTVAVYGLALQLLPMWGACLAAAFFAVHPVHVEAVANVVGQAEVLTALGTTLAVAWYVHARRAGALRPGAAIGILALYVFALLTKEHGVMLPALLVAAEVLVIPDERPLRVRARELRPFLLGIVLVTVAYFGARSIVLAEVGFAGFRPFVVFQILKLSYVDRVLTMLGVVPQWLRLMLWPSRLTTEYAPPDVDIAQGPALNQLPGVLLLIGILSLAVILRRRQPVVSFGIAWICLTLLPSSNFIVPAGILLSERTLFLPSVGALLAVVAALVAASERFRGLAVRVPAAVAAAAILVAGGIKSARRTTVWYDNERLFRQSVVDSPDSYRAHYMLGAWAFANQHKREGEAEYLRAMRLFPYDPNLAFSLGEQYRFMGLCEQANRYYAWSLALEPTLWMGRREYALCLMAGGRYAEAKQQAFTGLANEGPPPLFRQVLRLVDSVQRADLSKAGQLPKPDGVGKVRQSMQKAAP